MANWHWDGQLEIGTAGQLLTTGTGSPEGAVTAPIGSIYLRTDGGVGTSTYLKETGAGNTGWAAAAAGSTGPTGPTGPQAFGNYVTKTTSYGIQSSDNNTVFSFSGISLTATLPAAAPPVPWMVVVFNSAIGSMTLDFNGLHPNLPATLTLFSNQSAIIWSTGTTYTCIINSGWYTPAGSIISATGNAELDLFSTDDGGGWSLFDGNGNLIDTTSGTEMRFQTSTTFRFFGGGTTVQVDGILQTPTIVLNPVALPSTFAPGVPVVLSGSGSPEGQVVGVVGALYLNIAGGTGTTLYVKESGSGNTGWAGPSGGGGGGPAVATVSLSSTDLKNLRSTPKTLVAGQMGKTIVPLFVQLIYTFVTTPYSGVTGNVFNIFPGTNISLQYDSGISASGFVDQSTDLMATSCNTAPINQGAFPVAQAPTAFQGQDLSLGFGSSQGAAPLSLGDGTMTAIVSYVVV